jgi:hypothetical protein
MLDQKAGARSRFHSKRTRFSEPFSKSMKFTGFAAAFFLMQFCTSIAGYWS